MPDNNEIRSEEIQEILSYVPKWMIRWGNLLFLFLIITIITLSYFVKYPDIIVSTAIITTKTPPQKEFSKSTGKIDTIYVFDKQKVRTGQDLAIIENSANNNDVMILKSILETIRFNKDSFYFPIEKVPLLLLGDIDDYYSKFENNYIDYLINKDLRPYLNDIQGNIITSKELQKQLDNLIEQKKLSSIELKFKTKNLKRSESLYKDGVISEKDYEERQMDYIKAELDYKELLLSISKLRESVSKSKTTYRSAEFARTREEIMMLKKVIQSFNQLKKSITDWEMRYVLRAQMNGEISFLDFWSKNQMVNEGDLVFTILPTTKDSLIGKLKTPSNNLGKVRNGQLVQIKLDNYPDYEFGVIQGKIQNISTIADEKGFYSIDVELPQNLTTSYGITIDFRQEMCGTAEIVTEDLRLIQRIFYQINKIIKR